MEEPVGAQYAIQIAVHTLKDRCRSLQHRVANLEEENLRLRVQGNLAVEHEAAAPEADKLRQQVIEQAEEKQQLLHKIKMITSENQELWSKLGKLSKVNKNLGSELSKINESLMQHNTSKLKEVQSPLIRSKTFTQDTPQSKILQKNIEENNKISSELEEISLKILSSFAQGKSELDSLCAEIGGLDCGDIITDSFGYYYDDNIVEQFSAEVEQTRLVKESVLKQQEQLQSLLKELAVIQANLPEVLDSVRKKSVVAKEVTDKATSTIDANPDPELSPRVSHSEQQIPPQQGPPEGQRCADMICPLCSKLYLDIKQLQVHVEHHFIDEEYDMFS